jgi:O-succinylbenzoic acid--CoA ligase
VPDLVALVLPAGRRFVEQLERVWAAGDAALPLDPRTPPAHLERLLAELAPTHVVESDGQRRRLDGGRPVEVGDALVVATSGTTGRPKGAVHTHHGVEQAAYTTATAVGVAADTWWLGCLPVDHVGGLGVVTRALITGARLELLPGFDAAAVDDAARRGATHTSLVPTALSRIDTSAWRTILLGGSAIPTPRPANTIATYGMTETFGGVVYDGLTLNGVQLRIVEVDDTDAPDGRARSAPPGAIGPIELRSPTLLRCYRDGSDPLSPEGWYRTGDLGSIDPITRLLTVHGRGDDLIITGGEKVWPDPVEAVLATDHRVQEVAVVGLADPEWGQRVVAFVVPVDPSAPPPLEALRDLVRTQLPRAAAPKELRLVDSLPRTGLGKIRRSSLVTSGTEQHPDG